MGDFEVIGQQFITSYYQIFDEDRKNLGGLYRGTSMLNFETTQSQGTDAIMEKLLSLPLMRMKHEISTLNVQPGGDDGSIILLVTGQLLTDEERRGVSFAQAFMLKQDSGNGSYYVHNDLFNLVHG